LLAALLVVGWLGYMDPQAPTMLFILPGLMVAHVRLPVYSTMLVSGGRRERFLTAATLVAVIAILITAIVTVVATLSVSLAPIMPDITLRGTTFKFHVAHLQVFFFPLLMVPIVFTIQLMFFKKPFFMMVTVVLLFVLLFTGASAIEALSTIMDPIFLVVGLLVLSWVVFVVVLRYICTRRCLVGQ